MGNGSERVDAIGDLLLTATGGDSKSVSVQRQRQCSKYTHARFVHVNDIQGTRLRLDIERRGVLSYIKSICPNLNTLALNLEIDYASDDSEMRILKLLKAFSAHGWNMVAHEVVVFRLPSNKRQQRHWRNLFAPAA